MNVRPKYLAGPAAGAQVAFALPSRADADAGVLR